ncbi:MAG: hypothetical protein QXH24_06450 [Candidatus Bathyarchaeia archaeon]
MEDNGNILYRDGYKLKMPIIGRILRWSVESMIHSESPKRNPVRADGHSGRVIPIEKAKLIMMNLVAEPIVKNYCMCRMMQKGIKDACCINFGLLSGVIEKLPRFIPENKAAHNREEAVKALEEQNLKGTRSHSVVSASTLYKCNMLLRGSSMRRASIKNELRIIHCP